jgi:hypothetical protein
MSWLTSLFNWFFSSGAVDPSVITKVQAATVKLCGFLPAATTVAQLVAPGNPGVAAASVIAQKICGAVNAPTKMWLGAMNGEPQKPMVDGVVIEGEFINPKE